MSFNTFFLAPCGGAEGVQNRVRFNSLRELLSNLYLASIWKNNLYGGIYDSILNIRCSLSYQQAKWCILIGRQDVHWQILNKFQVKKVLENCIIHISESDNCTLYFHIKSPEAEAGESLMRSLRGLHCGVQYLTCGRNSVKGGPRHVGCWALRYTTLF